MNFDQLHYFLDVAETEHMTKSAQRLGVAQPALSRSIARLEKELGVALFARQGRGLSLTNEGKLAKKSISGIVDEMDALKRKLDATRLGEPSEIRIHLGAASRIAADAIAVWIAKNPTTKLTLTQSSGLDHDDADIVIDSSKPLKQGTCVRFEERIMVAAPGTLSFEKPLVSFFDLSELDFVSLSSQSGFTRFTQELCNKQGFRPNITFESDNPSVVRKMIGLGLGVGFWPEHSWGPVEGKDVRLLPLDTPTRRIVWAWLSDRSTNPAATEFFHHLTQHFETCFSDNRSSST